MSGDRQHYLPADLLGGFGVVPSGGRYRDAKLVALRKCGKSTGSVGLTTANHEAVQKKIYRLKNVSSDIDPDIVDTLWDTIEGDIPQLVQRLRRRILILKMMNVSSFTFCMPS